LSVESMDVIVIVQTTSMKRYIFADIVRSESFLNVRRLLFRVEKSFKVREFSGLQSMYREVSETDLI
jgi:hypothetical protein